MSTSLSTAAAVHLAVAGFAFVVGPFALASRRGSPRHRALGYIWVVAMVAAALSSLFIRNFNGLNLAGYTPIHLLVPVTLAGLGFGIHQVVRRRIASHRIAMWSTYLGGCVVAGLLTLLPSRYLGQLLWHHALGVL